MMVKEDAKVVQEILLKDAYNSLKFKNNETIRYTPSEVRKILEKALAAKLKGSDSHEEII